MPDGLNEGSIVISQLDLMSSSLAQESGRGTWAAPPPERHVGRNTESDQRATRPPPRDCAWEEIGRNPLHCLDIWIRLHRMFGWRWTGAIFALQMAKIVPGRREP